MAEIISINELRERQAAELTKLEFEARKIYLENYVSIVRRLEDTRVELEEAEMDIGPGAMKYSGMPRSGKVSDGSDRVISRMGNIKRLADSIRRDIGAMERKRDEIGKVIGDLSQGKLQEFLYYKYIRDMDLGEIADKMHYSYRQILNLHKQAVMRCRPPRYAIQKIKAELIEEHPEWAEKSA